MTETFNRYAGEVRHRIIRELRQKFGDHPIYGRDPYNLHEHIMRAMPTIDPQGKRSRFPSHAVIVTNSSNGMQRLAPDNFVGNYWSFVSKIDHQGDKPGLFLDWIEEDKQNITRQSKNEDVSSTLDGRKVKVSKTPVIDPRTTDTLYQPTKINIFINGERTFPVEIDGNEGIITLPWEPDPGDQILVTYWYRNLDSIGLYRVEITDVLSERIDLDTVIGDEINSFEFYIDTISKREELLTSAFNPSITQFVLDCPVLEVTYGKDIKGYALEVFVSPHFDALEKGTQGTGGGAGPVNQKNLIQGIQDIPEPTYGITRLIPGEDYLYEPTTQTITLIKPIGTSFRWPPNSVIYAAYRTEGETRGPFLQQRSFYNNRAINGVILAFGNQIVKGDQAFVEIYDERELVASVYGSLWDITLDFTVYAKDPNTSIELAKLVHQYLEVDLRPLLSFEGIEITQINMGGESTETHLEVTGDPYFTANINLTLNSFWERRYPIYGNFLEVFVDMFYVVDPTRSYYYIPRPRGGYEQAPLGIPEYNIPQGYPKFTGSPYPKEFNRKNPPSKLRKSKTDIRIGFL